MKDYIGVTIDRELLKEIEEQRGMTKRSTFINELLRLGLKAYKLQQQAKTKADKEPVIFNSNGEPWL
ncbi:MAG: ribbon-helix-helix domain-containing protein [Candidatus Bathyarchaeia archaeon]